MAVNLAPTKSEYIIPKPTKTTSVSPVPDRSDSLSWMALSETETTGTDATGTNDIALTMSTISNDHSSQASLRRLNTSHGLKRGQTMLDGLEQSGLDRSEMRNQPEIKHKLIMFVTLPCLCMAVIWTLNEMESAQYKIMSLCVGIFSITWFAYWFYLIGSSSQLHRIRLITTRFDPFYGNMVFPTSIKHYPSRPIKSISETLALRGSSIHIYFVFMGMANACVTANAVMLNWLDLRRYARLSNEEMNINYLEQALAICSVFAMPMVGFFELDVHSPCLMLMHYVGVLCEALMVWPFAIQSDFSVTSISIIAVTYLALAMWWFLGSYYPDDLVNEKDCSGMAEVSASNEDKMKKAVHLMSLKCLLPQTIGAIGCMTALSMYLWNIQEVGCSD